MLVDEQDSNIFPVMSIPVKGLLNGGGLGLGIDDEEVLLGVGGLCDVLCNFQRRFILSIVTLYPNTCKEQARDRVLDAVIRLSPDCHGQR